MKDGEKVYPVRNNARFSAMGLDFTIIPAWFNAPMEFLTGFTGIPRWKPYAASE
jgi:hypothetical protein